MLIGRVQIYFIFFFFFRSRENKLQIVGPLYLDTIWQAFIFNFQDTGIFIYNNDQNHSFIKYKLWPDKRARLSNKKNGVRVCKMTRVVSSNLYCLHTKSLVLIFHLLFLDYCTRDLQPYIWINENMTKYLLVSSIL